MKNYPKDKEEQFVLKIPKDISLKNIFSIHISDIIYLKFTYRHEEGIERKILGNLWNIDINLIYKDKINIKEEHFFLRELIKMTLDEKSVICNTLERLQNQIKKYYPSKLISVEGNSPILTSSNSNNNYKIFVGNIYIGQMINNEIFNDLDKSTIDNLDKKYYGNIYDKIYDQWDPKENLTLNKGEDAVTCFSIPETIDITGKLGKDFLVRIDQFISFEVVKKEDIKTKKAKEYIIVINYYKTNNAILYTPHAKNREITQKVIKYSVISPEQKNKIEEVILIF